MFLRYLKVMYTECWGNIRIAIIMTCIFYCCKLHLDSFSKSRLILWDFHFECIKSLSCKYKTYLWWQKWKFKWWCTYYTKNKVNSRILREGIYYLMLVFLIYYFQNKPVSMKKKMYVGLFKWFLWNKETQTCINSSLSFKFWNPLKI